MSRKKIKSEPILRKLTDCEPNCTYFVEKLDGDGFLKKAAIHFGLFSNNKIKLLMFDPKKGDVNVKNGHGKFWIDKNLAEKIIVRDNK